MRTARALALTLTASVALLATPTPAASLLPEPVHAPTVTVPSGLQANLWAVVGPQLAMLAKARDIATWNAAVAEGEQRARAARDRAAAQARAVAPANHGAHSDAWWHGVSVCEQGGRNDSFFGYFSIMDGSAGGLSWGTQVGMANQIIDRAGDYAWAAACVHAGYAAAPGG